MNEFELNATRRTDMGKAAARRLRRSGMIPGVLYGAGADVLPMQIDQFHLRKQLENEAFFSHILKVTVDGEPTQAVVKALQRNPGSQEVTHIDLLRVSSTTELTMNVPLHFVNEDESVGKKAGGVVSHLMVDVEIACLPKDLPEFIEVDVVSLDVGDSLHLSELKMPEGVRLTTDVSEADHDHPVVSVQHAQAFEEPELEEELEGEVAEVTDEAATEEAEEAAKEE